MEFASFNVHLDVISVEDELKDLLINIALGTRYVRNHLYASKGFIDSKAFANGVFTGILREEDSVLMMISDELADTLHVDELANGDFVVAYNALDGNDGFEKNIPIGSSFGIYKGDGFKGLSGKDLVATLIVVYGPRTFLYLAVDGSLYRYRVNHEEDYILDAEVVFGGNGQSEGVTGTESLIADLGAILNVGGAVEVKDARLLFEGLPFAYLIEATDGVAVSGSKRVLDMEASDLSDKVSFVIGTKDSVKNIN